MFLRFFVCFFLGGGGSMFFFLSDFLYFCSIKTFFYLSVNSRFTWYMKTLINYSYFWQRQNMDKPVFLTIVLEKNDLKIWLYKYFFTLISDTKEFSKRTQSFLCAKGLLYFFLTLNKPVSWFTNVGDFSYYRLENLNEQPSI